MADVAASLKDWSTTAASNSPTDATTVGAGLADNLQEIQKVVRQDLAHKGADIASAGTTDLGAVAGSYHDITGTTTITAFGTVSAGISKELQFDGAVQLTHNSTSLILPGGANITTAAGDHLRAMSLGSGNWVVTNFSRASGATVRAIDSARNALLNGDFTVWQRGTSFGTSGVTYTADAWKTLIGSPGVATVTRGSSVPTVAQSGRVVPYSYSVDITTADASVGVSDAAYIYQAIEGSRWAQFAQQALTVSFWARSTVTGTYCVALSNAVDRTFVRTYTISSADTWEFKTVSFDASPSAGTWNYTTGTAGAYLFFVLQAGTNFHTTAGSWISSGTVLATSAQANAISSTSNFFMLAGVQMERGGSATPFDAVPFDNELRRCQRHYSKSFPYATAPAQNVGSNLGALTWVNILGGANGGGSQTVYFPATMMTTPAVTLYNPSAANAQIRNLSTAADWTSSVTSQSDSGFYVSGTQDAGSVAGTHRHAVHWSASAEL
jgi:hypothetical protein